MNRRVLIVDDDKDVRYLLRVMLNRAGFDVVEASNGEQALELLHASPPVACVLDVMMPKMTGLEVCRRVRANDQTRTVPVIILTAYDSEINRLEAFRAGATEFIAKPFSARNLVERVRQMVD